MSDRTLGAMARIGFAAANTFLGVIPCVLFFAWIERNMGLPWLPLELAWPWVDLAEWPLLARIAWDVALFIAFGAVHSALAQPRAHAGLRWLVPPQAIRAVYLIATGLTLAGVMGLWQATGVVVWAAPWGAGWVAVVSMPVFWALMTGAMALLCRFGVFSFFGYSQLFWPESRLVRSEGTPRLIVTGLYRYVRHPVYLMTLAAMVAAPVLPLDRVVLAAAALAYLAFGIPIEERKLLAQFGPAYAAYRRRVPAVFPRPWPAA